MIKIIKGIFSTSTFQHTVVTSAGTIINGILGLIFYVWMARILGPASFGIFSVATTTTALLSSIFNVGVDTGIVRFVGRYFTSDPEKANKFLKIALKVKMISGILLIFIGWMISPIIIRLIFNKPELIFPIRLSLVGAFGWLLSSFATSTVQAMQKFWHWSGLNISINLLRLLAIEILVLLNLIHLDSGLYVYVVTSFFGFFLGLMFLPKFWNVKNEKEVAGDFFKYNKWVAIFTVIVAISSRVDTYLSTRLISFSDLGIYSVATNLSSIVPEIVLALATVVAPKFANQRNNVEAKKYFNKLQLFVLGLAVVGLVFGIPFSYFLIPKLYGPEYLRSVLPFSILLLAQAVFLISVPIHTAIFYYFSYPKIFVKIALAHLFLVLILGWIFIGKFGYVGAAFTMLMGNIFNLVIPGFWVMNQFRKEDK
jgi:O-antigen/teichoic acid export membrane protein